jgi:putative ABC transport system permease protein
MVVRMFRRILRVVLSLAGRGPVSRDLEEEVAGYLDMLVDEKVASGMSRDEARRQARLELGGEEQVKESVRAGRPAAWLDTLARDVRYSVRLLAQAPTFSLTAISVLALGIGANVAMFGLINLLLLQPLVGSDQPGRVAGVYCHDPKTPDSYRRFSYAEYRDIGERPGVLGHLMAHRAIRAVYSGGDTTRRASVEEVTSTYFSTLGVRLAAGRAFTPEEERPGSRAAVAVLNDVTWRALGGNSSVLGRTIFFNSRAFTVVGVAPAGFTGTQVAFGPLAWIPLGADDLVSDDPPADEVPTPPVDRGRRDLQVVARLEPGVSIETATAALGALPNRIEAGPAGSPREVLTVSELARTQDGTDPKSDSQLLIPLGTLAGMAVVLLAVASLNVANMQLARGMNRRRETAMRLALGAGRGRIVTQLLTEGLLLSMAGGAAGLVVGVWALKLVAASFTPMIDESISVAVTPDVRVVAAALGFSLLSAAVFALGPAWALARLDLLPHLKGASGRTAGAGGGRGLGPRNLVVAGQVALSLALLAAAGLFVRGAVAAGHADPGYRLEGQLLVRADATGSGAVRGRRAFADVLDRLRATPGVQSASIASLVAFGNESASQRVRKTGTSSGAGSQGSGGGIVALNFTIGSAYFRTLGVPMLRGREFTTAEEREPGSPAVAIIDEPLAAALFPGQEAVGQHVELVSAGSGRAVETMEIVGVAPGLRHRLTNPAPVAHVYVPLGSHYQPRLNIHVRVSTLTPEGEAGMLPRLRDALRAADDRMAVLSVSTLQEARDASPVNWLVRTAGQAFGALGLIGLAMAVIGLYGVKAYLVARRTREIGIRMALGATPADVIGMILKEGSRLVGAGVVAGVLLALGAGRVIGSLLVGVRPTDPLVLFLATLVLTLAVLAASYVPARRATRIAPAVALRIE